VGSINSSSSTCLWGREFKRLSYSRSAGVSGTGSQGASLETYVSGRLFNVASISTTKVCRLMCPLPNTFFRQLLVNSINLSQNPPYQGALFGMNFQVTPGLLRVVMKSRVEKLSQFLRSQQMGGGVVRDNGVG